jgi:CheY-like chemotaxis protein
MVAGTRRLHAEKIRRLKHKTPIPAAAVSAYTSVEARHKSNAAGFRFHISKPIDVAKLVMKIAILAGRAEIQG